ncbi:MAG TPA: ATP-dependent DNA ligase [Actinomycetota bacterium]|nr:ATP-dependent DNA ligase [Actinomycetota bacterium]
MALPIAPPIAPMLAKLQEEIPTGEGWLYEPKWDGFRALVWRDGSSIEILSRDGRDLVRYFPELPAVFLEKLPRRCVVDGEVILAGSSGLDFDGLQMRIHPARSRVEMLASKTPASFIAFDLLAVATRDLMQRPFSERRAKLEDGLGEEARFTKNGNAEITALKGQTKVLLTPQTGNVDAARSWFKEFEAVGLDGLIAKRAEGPYVPGKRVMVKIKHQRTADCVVGGYRLSKAGDGIGSLLLGVYDDGGELQYVGHTSSFKAPERRALLKQLRALEGGPSFGAGRAPGGPSRWAGMRDSSWVSVKPELVCEVSFDYMQGHRFRHAATFIRWRTDKKPKECRFDQFSRPPRR